MRRRLGRRLFGAMTTCGLMIAGPALAGGSGMPWEGPLQQVVESIRQLRWWRW
jgi:type IV secretion system protein TrbC